jgi:hypothetical protein
MKRRDEKGRTCHEPQHEQVPKPKHMHEPQHEVEHEEAPPLPQDTYPGGPSVMSFMSLYVNYVAKHTWEGNI